MEKATRVSAPRVRTGLAASYTSAGRRLCSSAGVTLHRLGRLVRDRSAVRILYYHSISDDPIRSRVSPAVFASQMEFLARNQYCLLSLSEAVQRLSTGVPFPDRSVAVTLDDGFVDNYEHALPILKRWNVPATVFLTVSYIGTDRLPTLTRTDFVPRPLSWEQVTEMHREGIEFGSHTLTHPMLSRVSPDLARQEIVDSRRRMEDVLGSPVSLFCYPRGDYDDVVKRIVRDEGYAAACSTIPGLNGRDADRYALRRTYVSRHDTSGEFAKKMAGGYDLIQTIGARWHRLRRG